MTDLALHQKIRPVALSTISARQGTSLSYLEQLFSALRRAGLVDSTRGPGGGYTLARNLDQISVAEIIVAVENLKADDLPHLEAGQAAQAKSMTGELWTNFNTRVMEYLQSVTLQDLVAQQRARGVVVEETVPAPAPRPKLSVKPKPLMARVGVPNSVFALGALPVLQRR
jgi:Rrf2 family iron-sulfur cluster assembly transcriptional regulator